MPERRPPQVPLVLRATITLDGKLDDAPLETVRGAQVDPVDPAQSRALLEAGAVDEIHLTIRPRIDGRRGAPTLSGLPGPEFFPRSLACRLLRMKTHHGECLLQYRVLRPARKAVRAV